MNKYINELFGTFFLALTILVSLKTGALGIYQPFVIGTLLVTLIYADRKISGAHYNPAVTIGVWLRGKCTLAEVPGYIASQLVAGLLAALLCNAIDLQDSNTAVGDLSRISSSLAEVAGTFILVYVILFVATAKRTEGNSYYGLAIGYTVTVCAYLFGGLGSLGCFNPAVALSLLIGELHSTYNFILITFCNLIGGALAAIVFTKGHVTAEEND